MVPRPTCRHAMVDRRRTRRSPCRSPRARRGCPSRRCSPGSARPSSATTRSCPVPTAPRRVTYADYTASGRALAFIEDFIRDQVLPRYANTHTESSGTGRQTTRLREDARQIIRDAVGGDDDTCVIFCGVRCHRGHRPADRHPRPAHPVRARGRVPASTRTSPPTERPVVFIGPFEHHSNELPWRESIADVVRIPEDADGHIDQTGSGRAARALRRPTAEDRRVLRREQRHRHRQRHLRHLRPAAPPRRPRRVGLRRRRPVRRHRHGARRRARTRWPTRTPSSCPRTSSSADPAPRASWRSGASCSRTGCPPSSAAAPSPTSTPRSTCTSPTRSTARRPAPRRSSSRSGPAWSSS